MLIDSQRPVPHIVVKSVPLPKLMRIDPQGPVSPIAVKSVYCRLGHIERSIHTKFDI